MSPTTTFQSVTTWQAMPFMVELRYGFFSTPHEAAAMAKTGIERLIVGGDGLWVDRTDRTRAPVRDDSFTVMRLRDEAARSGELSMDDFEPVVMTVSDMLKEPAMRSFESCSWGVCDESGHLLVMPKAS